MDALLSRCARADGERIDPSLSPAPSTLAEDGRGVLYALGADGVTRAAAARHVNAAFRARDGDGAHDDDDEDDDDASAFLRESVREYAPDPPLDFEPRTIAVSPSGHFAAIGGLRHALRAAGDAQTDPIPPSSALSVVTLRAATTLERRDAGDPGCRVVSLLVDRFASHASVRVLRASWHPRSDSHLVVLLSDGTLHVFDAAAGCEIEQAFRLDPWGRGPAPGPFPLRPEIVDFDFAPPHGWGALSLILLGREGDVYTLCPFAPYGARYPRVTLESLQCDDANSEAWLEGMFPTLRRTRRRRRRGGPPFPPPRGSGSVSGSGGESGGASASDDDDGDDGDDASDPDVDDDAADSDDDGRGGEETYGDAAGDGWTGRTVSAKRATLQGVAAALRGPLPLGTGPCEGDDDDGGGGGGGGMLGRGVVARSLAAAPFAAGEGGGALLAVAHQRAASASTSTSAAGRVSATLDILILPSEPAPGWAATNPDDDAAAIEEATLSGGPPTALTPVVTDYDESSLPPLLAIDRVQLVSGESTMRPHASRIAAAANELAPFVRASWDPACRERVYCAAGGAVHSVTLTWLHAVEGAVDDESAGGDGGGNGGGELSLPIVSTLVDGEDALLGVAAVGDPLAEGLLVAVDARGASKGLHPPPPLPVGVDDADGATKREDADAAARARATRAAAEASAELRALAAGPGGGPFAPPADAAGLKPGTVEGNAALATAAAGLKERHLRYAHRVHAATRRHTVRLAAEIKRQRAEAAAVREGLEAIAARRENLAEQLEQAREKHEEIRARLRALTKAERNLPHPLTRAEKAFATTLNAAGEDLPLLQAKLEELRRRADAVGDLFPPRRPPLDAGAADVRARPITDPRVAEEIARQDADIKKNLDMIAAIERMVGTI